MLTALLLLLGLSGAGAGLYSVLKDPSEPGSESDSNVRPRNDSKFPQSNSANEGRQKSGPGKSASSMPSAENFPLGEYGNEAKQSETPKKNQNFPPGIQAPKISYPVDDIISKNSKYSHHRRPIINAEALIDKLNIHGAMELYQRVSSRIPDQEIIEKIQTNIEDLKKFIESSNKLDDLFEGNSPELEYENLKNNIPISGPIPIRDLAEAIREISEALAESLQKGFLPSSPPSYPSSPPPGVMPPPGQPSSVGPEFTKQLPPDYFPAPIVYQFVSPTVQNLSPTPTQPSVPGSITAPSSFPTGAPQQLPPLPRLESIPDQVGFPDENWSTGNLDLPDDTFFSREWDKFKDLPLTDRRSGKERRQTKDRRTGFNRKDRRSGEDRRKVDLFQEREDYLKKKALEKKDANQNNPQTGSLSDTLEPYYPPASIPDQLTEINLPDPDEFKVQDGRIIRISLEPWEVNDVNLPEPVTITLPESTQPNLEIPPPPQPVPLPDAKTETAFPQSPEDYVGLPDPENFELEAKTSKKSDDNLPPQLPEPDTDKQRPDLSSDLDFGLPEIGLPDPEDFATEKKSDGVLDSSTPEYEERFDEEGEIPDIEVVDGDLDEQLGEIEPVEKEPEKILHGVLELKPPEVDDAPFLTLTYDFGKIPHGFRLSRNYSIMEYSYYKYKPMLMKAQEFARRKMLKNALNYYRVVKSQNIPPEMRKMINRNIRDITEFMEKFLMAKGG